MTMECLSCGDQLSCLTQQTNAPEKALEKSAGKNGTSAGKPAAVPAKRDAELTTTHATTLLDRSEIKSQQP